LDEWLALLSPVTACGRVVKYHFFFWYELTIGTIPYIRIECFNS